MKKILLPIFIFLSFSATSQVIEKGKKILGGSVSLGFNFRLVDTASGITNASDGKNFGISLSPSIGKAIKNDLVLGYSITAGYGYAMSNSRAFKSMDKAKHIQGGVGIFLEKFIPLGKSFSLSAKTGANVNYYNSRLRSFRNDLLVSNQKSNRYGINLYLMPSLTYALNKRMLVQIFMDDFISVFYNYTSYKTETNGNTYTDKYDDFGLSSSLNGNKQINNLSFAFRYIL